MSNIIIYDTNTNKVIEYLKSVNTPDYDGRNDVVINPSIPSIEMKYWKHETGQILEMTQAEKDAVDQAEAQAQAQAILDAIDKYEVSTLEIITALVKRINVRIPANPITKAEIIQQLKTDRGL